MVKMMNKRTVSAEERKNVITVLSELLSKDDKILFAYLHGSFVAKEKFNDLDIAIYFKDMTVAEMLDYELKLEDRIEKILRIPIDLKSLNNAPVTFCYMVIKKGVKVIVNDDKSRVDFEMSTYRNYFDFQPHRRRYLQEVLNVRL